MSKILNLLFVTLIFGSFVARADSPLPAAPATGWCYATQSGSTYNGVAACAVTPPPPPPGACPAGRFTRGQIEYGNYTFVNNVDLTDAVQVWGRISATQTPLVQYPYQSGSGAVITNLPKAGYVAIHMHTQYSSPRNTIVFQTMYNTNQQPMDWSISTSCGDFNPAWDGCHNENVYMNGYRIGETTLQTTNTGRCPVLLNQDYYINMKFHNPAQCAGASCKLGVQIN